MAYEIEKIFADVAIAGGGLAGGAAAIKAGEAGHDVVVIERADTNRSGCAGSGIDHLWSYVPPVHEKIGYTKELMKKDMADAEFIRAGLGDSEISDYFVDVCFERMIELEKYGVKMRFPDSRLADGFRLVPQFQSIPTSINFEGRDIKVKLTNAMRRAGVRIINHAAVVKILKDNHDCAAGLIAISSREDKIYVVESKAAVIATNGGGGRLGNKVNVYDRYYETASASGAGFGISLPLDAGAEVANLEFSLGSGELAFHGFSTRVGSPGSSWWPCAQVVDDDGTVVVHRIRDYDINEPDYLEKNVKEYAHFMDEFYSMHGFLAEGRQLYMDFSEATDEELAYVEWTLGHEGRMWLYVQNLKRTGVRLKDIQVPYVYDPGVRIGGPSSGVFTNRKGETTIKGLYVAGDARGLTMGSGSCAIVSGDEAGIQAGEYIKTHTFERTVDDHQVQAVLHAIHLIRENPKGEKWSNVESAIRGIVAAFGSKPLTDTKIKHALALLKQLKEKPNFYARDPRDTVRSFEVLSLLDAAEAIFTAAQHRDKAFGPYRKVKAYRDAECGENAGKAGTAVVYGLYKDAGGQYAFNVHDYVKGSKPSG
jgi:succinate dehydrogenase/fumarate reductase flavoprotein subunit